jgi:transposase
MALLGVSVWRSVLGVDRATVIEEIEFDEESESVVFHVRPRRSTKRRCGRCGERAPLYDQGSGRRRWRALDLGVLACHLESDSPRVNCSVHGITVAQVPWARHDAGHTRDFDDQAAWLATHTSKTAVQALLRIAWRTVGSIIERVVAEGRAAKDPFEGLRRIGIDEISYKKGHRYLTICVDHDTGRLLWAGVGRDKATLRQFFDLLGDERCQAIRLVSADAAEWIGNMVKKRCPNATLCIDPFHVVQWTSGALDEVRSEVWKEARKRGMDAQAKALKGCRYALWKNPEHLTDRQKEKLAWIAEVNGPLYLAYLMKEQLRSIIKTKGEASLIMLEVWLEWVADSDLPAMVEVGRKINNNRAGIEAALTHNLSNGLVESTNTKLRVLHRMAYGFKKPEHLIALALLDRGGYCPPLPGRQAA